MYFSQQSEQNFIPQEDIDYFLILNTESMIWEKGKFEGTPPLNRYGHTSSSIGPHILIFGTTITLIQFNLVKQI